MGAPEWFNYVVTYSETLSAEIGAELVGEPYDSGRSFETKRARMRFSKGGLSIIVEFDETSDLWVESDGRAITNAFRKADAFDGGVVSIRSTRSDKPFASAKRSEMRSRCVP